MQGSQRALQRTDGTTAAAAVTAAMSGTATSPSCLVETCAGSSSTERAKAGAAGRCRGGRSELLEDEPLTAHVTRGVSRRSPGHSLTLFSARCCRRSAADAAQSVLLRAR